MSVHVFLGPSLGRREARAALRAKYHPPAAVGDVYRVARSRDARAILIIDGAFEQVPAVWHKEVLWAMSEGVHVVGAASMGALRAAELSPFGMLGIGAIFEHFRSGRLEDDDEVAVTHARAEGDYRVTSEALVNIRATLSRALSLGIITSASERSLVQLAKQTYYADRSFPKLLEDAERAQLSSAEVAQLKGWLKAGRVDQKREDALAALRFMHDHKQELAHQKRVTYVFEHTHTWEELHRYVLASSASAEDEAADLDGQEPSEGIEVASLLDELRLEGRFMTARRAALARWLAINEADRAGYEVEEKDLLDTAEQLRRERGLLKLPDFQRWLAENELDETALERFFRDEARLRWMEENLREQIATLVADHLRASGEYTALRERVARKDEALSATNAEATFVAPQTNLDDASVWAWYFRERRQSDVPGDLTTHAQGLGFADLPAFRQAVFREYLFSNHPQ